jgi:HEAT repeat protein
MNLVGRLQADRHIATLRAIPAVGDPRRIQARRRLIELGSVAVPPLLDALKASEGRAAVAEVLENLLDDASLPLFLRALSNAEPGVGQAVTDILVRIRSYDPTPLLGLFADPGVSKARVETVLSAQMPRLQPRLLMALVPELSREARAITFRLLDRHADATVVSDSLRLADDPDWWIRLQMARLLARVTTPTGTETLVRLLRDENRGVRLEAVRSLGRHADPGVIPALCGALRDADLRVQTAAIDALVTLADPAAVPHLVDVLKDEVETARRAAVEVLNAVATPEAVKDLVMALRDADWWVRARAADALGTIGGAAVVEAVVAILGDGDEHVRRYAVEILNVAGDARAVEPLIRALDDTDWWVRERAIDALAGIRDPRAVAPLAELLFRDAGTALLCVRALQRIAHESSLDVFARLLDSGSDELRHEAIEGLRALFLGEVGAEARRRLLALLASVGVDPTQRPTPTTVGRAAGSSRAVPGGDADHAAAEPAPRPAVPPAMAAPRPAFHDISALEPGEVLAGRYEVVRKIGGGGFGTVYLVEDVLIRDELILKILAPQLTTDATMMRRFIQEMRVSRRITHPNVIRTHEFVDLGGLHAIAMEYFPSRDLADILKGERPLAAARVVPIAIQVCEALAAAHELGTIHRDVKPGNILVGAGDRVKVVDFGLAAVGMQTGSRLTRSGLLIGTPEYMAPEQIAEGTADARSDIYSLGVVLYEALSGIAPFAGENAAQVLFNHIEGNVPPLGAVAPDVPAGLGLVVMHALARRPDDRPATAAELADRLRGLHEQRPPAADATPGEAAA